MRRTFLAVVIFCASGGLSAGGFPSAQESASERLRLLERDFWAWNMKVSPEAAYFLGVKERAEVLSDFSPAALKRCQEELEAFARRAAGLRRAGGLLGAQGQADLRHLEDVIQASLKPDVMSDPQASLYLYTNLPLYYLNQRMTFILEHPADKAAWARIAEVLEGLPRFYENGKTQLRAGLAEGKAPYRYLVQRNGIDEAQASAKYFSAVLPAQGAAALGPAHQVALRLTPAGAAAAKAVLDFAAFLEKEVLPAARNDFAVGESAVNGWLAREAGPGVDAGAALRRLEERSIKIKAEFEAVEAELARQLGVPREQAAAAARAAPQSDEQLLGLYQAAAVRAEDFIRSKNVLALPKGYKLRISKLPDTLADEERALPFLPPVYRDGVDGALYVAPSRGDPRRMAQHFIGEIAPIVVHESLPGHDVQFSWFRKLRDSIPRTRFIGQSTVNVEGWAVYVSELMRRKGFFTKAEEYMFLAEQDTSLSYAILDLSLHAGRKTAAQFSEQCRQGGWTDKEIDGYLYRCALIPLQSLSYPLGQMAIEDLKNDYQKAKGAGYSDAKFHQEFLKQGPLPVHMIRKLLLPDPLGVNGSVARLSESAAAALAAD